MRTFTWLLLAIGMSGRTDASRHDAQRTVTQPHYTAVVDALGNLASLQIGGMETSSKAAGILPRDYMDADEKGRRQRRQSTLKRIIRSKAIRAKGGLITNSSRNM